MLDSLLHSQKAFLDWKDRPIKVKDKINECWDKLNKKTEGVWGYNGDDSYLLAYINEYAFIKAIIKANPDRTEFSVLDVGAGNFQFGRALAKLLNEDIEIPQNVRVNIIGVRGEVNSANEESEIGICHLYELGFFKIEDIGSELNNRVKRLQPIDLAVSAWTFRHLVDPVGTFVQVYNLLHPQSGHFLLDGFFYVREDKEGVVTECPRKNMLALLQDLSEPFLIHGYNAAVYLSGKNDFSPILLKRTNPNECQIPLEYVGLDHGRTDNASNCTTKFKECELPMTLEPEGWEETAKFKGNKVLYDFLVEHSIFNTPVRTQYSGPVVPRTQKSQPDLLSQIREVPVDTKLLIFIAKDRKQIKATLTALSTEEPVANRTRSKTKLS